MNDKTIRFKSWNCKVNRLTYNEGEPAIELVDVKDGESIAIASVWVPGLREGEVAIKDYSENEGMLDLLIKEEIINKPHRYVQSGYVKIPVCTLY